MALRQALQQKRSMEFEMKDLCVYTYSLHKAAKLSSLDMEISTNASTLYSSLSVVLMLLPFSMADQCHFLHAASV